MTTNKSLLKNHTLLTIGIAESISGIGDWITMMAVFALLVFRGGGGVAQSSGVFLAGLVPTLLASPVAGWLCDRVDRKKLMLVSQLSSGVIVSGLIFVERLEFIYILLALQAVAYAVMAPARQAVVPDIVPSEDLTRANAFLQQLSSVIKIGAPMLAGMILGVLGPHQAIILDVISFAFAALILSRLPALPPRGAQGAAPTAQTGEAHKEPSNVSVWQVLKTIPQLRILFFSAFMGILVIVGFDVLSSVYVRDTLGQNEQFFGLLIGLVGVGTLLATVYLMTRKTVRNLWADLAIGLLLLSAIPFSLFISAQIENQNLARLLVLGFVLIGGVGNGLLTVQLGTLLQTLTPARVLGQIGGVFQSTAVAGQLVGIVVTPWLVSGVLSMQNYFAVSGGLLALMSLVLFFQLSGNLRSVTPALREDYIKQREFGCKSCLTPERTLK